MCGDQELEENLQRFKIETTPAQKSPEIPPKPEPDEAYLITTKLFPDDQGKAEQPESKVRLVPCRLLRSNFLPPSQP